MGNDLQQLASLLHDTIQEGLRFLENLDKIPTSADTSTLVTSKLKEGIGAAGALSDFIRMGGCRQHHGRWSQMAQYLL